MSTLELAERPAVVQGGLAPLFKGAGEENLLCSCGHVLIEGYVARQYIGIGLICFRCKAFMLSDPWPVGEPLPKQIVTLGRSGRYLLGSTVDVTGKAGFTCDQEIERVQHETGVRQPESNNLQLSTDWLDKFQARLNAASEGEMDKCVQSAMRARAGGNKKYLKSPPAWAIGHLRDCLSIAKLDLDHQEDCAALAYIQVLEHLMARWEHHPLFSLMSKAMVLEYPHAITQLIAASYLADHGNEIGFTDLTDLDGRSPDLFLNFNCVERISIEVKAPAELQWPNECPSANRIEKIVMKQIQKAKGQLTGELGGIVVIGASWLSKGAESSFEAVVIDLERRGKISSKITAVVGICLYLAEGGVVVGGGKINTEFLAQVFVCPNSRFSGPAYFKS